MSNNKLNNIVEVLKNVSLSETERSSLRNHISKHIEANQPVRSPWAPILSPLQQLSRSGAFALAVVMLMVGGVSMAAENALPGDPLYSFKLNVNESFLSLTSLSPNSDAVHESRLANRRIAELETLAARGQLSEIVSSNLTTAISQHAALAREEIAKISARGEAGDAASLETELSSTLEMHSDILANLIGKDGQQATATANAAARLRAVAQEKTDSSVSATSVSKAGHRTGLENQRQQLSSVETKRLLERTAERLSAARGQFTSEVADIESDKVKLALENLLTASAKSVDQAIDLIDEDKYKEADPLLRQALTYAHRATVLMNARRALELSSGIAIDDLIDISVFAVEDASSSIDTQVGGADVTPDDEAAGTPGVIMTTSQDETASSSSSTPAVQGTSTTATSSASSSESQSFTRERSVNTEADRQIEQVLQRVKETLESHTPQGFLPARTSHGEEN